MGFVEHPDLVHNRWYLVDRNSQQMGLAGLGLAGFGLGHLGRIVDCRIETFSWRVGTEV